MSDSVREAFEKWARENGHDIHNAPEGFDCDYFIPITNRVWESWQAATAAADAKCKSVGDERYGTGWFDGENSGHHDYQSAIEESTYSKEDDSPVAVASYIDNQHACIDKLVGVCNAYKAKAVGGCIIGQSKQPHELAEEALAQAAQLMGRK